MVVIRHHNRASAQRISVRVTLSIRIARYGIFSFHRWFSLSTTARFAPTPLCRGQGPAASMSAGPAAAASSLDARLGVPFGLPVWSGLQHPWSSGSVGNIMAGRRLAADLRIGARHPVLIVGGATRRSKPPLVFARWSLRSSGKRGAAAPCCQFISFIRVPCLLGSWHLRARHLRRRRHQSIRTDDHCRSEQVNATNAETLSSQQLGGNQAGSL
jgi:hypothetical protein